MRTRHRFALVVAGGLVLAASAIATVTRDSAVKERLEALLAHSLAAPCDFDSAHLSFLEGLRVRGLRILDPSDPLLPPLVEVDEARIDYHIGLFGSGPRITVIVLHSPTVRLRTTDDGVLTLATIVAPSDEGGPRFHPPAIRVFDGTVVVEGEPFLQPGAAATVSKLRADFVPSDGSLRIPDGHGESDLIGAFDFTLDAAADGSFVAASLDIAEVDLRELRDSDLPEALTDILREFDVAGTATATARLTQQGDRHPSLAFEARLRDATARTTLPEREGLPEPRPVDLSLRRATVALQSGRLSIREAEGEALGAGIEIEGGVDLGGFDESLDDSDRTIDVTAKVRGAMVGPLLARHFPRHLQDVREMLALSGRTDAEIYVVGGLSQIRTNVDLHVHGVTASYLGFADAETGKRDGGFPWRVDGLTGDIGVVGSRVEWDARGVHGAAAVHVVGFTDKDALGRTLTDVRVDASDVPLDDDLHAGFRDRAEKTLGPWKPSGTAARIEVHVQQDPTVGDDDLGTQIVATLDGRASFVPHVFPTPLRDVHGVVHILEPVMDGTRTDLVRLEGVRAEGDGFTVTGASGTTDNDSEDLDLAFSVQAIDGEFRVGITGSTVVPDGVKRSLELLEPRGRAEIDAKIVGGADGRRDVIRIELADAAVRGWEGVPLVVSELRGELTYEDDAIRTDGLRGTVLGGAPIRARGGLSELSADAPVPDLVVEYTRGPLDGRLRDALGVLVEDVTGVWEAFPPADDFRADVTATIRPPGSVDGELSLVLENVRGGIEVLDLPLRASAGHVAYEMGLVRGSLVATRGSGEVDVPAFTYETETELAHVELALRGLALPDDLIPLLSEEAAASIREGLGASSLHVSEGRLDWHGTERRLTASAETWLRPASRDGSESGLEAEAHLGLSDVVVVLPEEGATTFEGRAEVHQLAFDPGLDITELTGGLAFRGELGGDEPTVEISLAGGTARAEGMLVEDLSLALFVNGPRLRIPDIRGTMYGGKMTARFNQGGERLAYRGAFAVEGGDLALYGEDQQKPDLAGKVDLDTRFRNPTGRPEDLEGTGRMEIAGAAVRIPFITAAARAVDNALLGATAIEGEFHAGHIEFDLRGHRMLIRDLFFEGPSVPLLLDATMVLRDGRGGIDMADGRLDLVMSPRIEFGVLDYDPTGIFQRVFGLAQVWLRRLRVEGTTRNPRTSWEIGSDATDDEFRPRPRPIGEIRPFGAEPW